MEMEIIVIGVPHYDMSSDGGQKGASVKLLGNHVVENNYFGVQISESTIDYAEIPNLINYELPAKFKAKVSFGSAKKNGSKKEVTTLHFTDLKYITSLELQPKKGA